MNICNNLYVMQEGDGCLQLATKGNRSKRNHWILCKPTNYTSVGVSVGRGHEALLSANQ